MSSTSLLLALLVAAAGAVVVTVCLRIVWRVVGVYRISRAGPRRLFASNHVIWRDPGDVARLNLAAGPGGPEARPQGPFRFLEEHLTGSQPCVSVLDGKGRRWRVKWGEEVRAENFAVRLAWACGYFAETTHFIASGSITGAENLQRARDCIGADCRFADARFELDDPAVRKHFEEHSWAWNDNPFVGTPELHGLKILVMLMSDWDTKDRRDVARGSNTAIFEHRVSRFRREARYLITDWGGSMGRWGSSIVTRGRWDPDGFATQTEGFVAGVSDGEVQFGYVGQRTSDVASGIRVSDVRWLLCFLGRITDEQVRAALTASGADEPDTERFTRAIRERIGQLQRAVGPDVSGAGAASP